MKKVISILLIALCLTVMPNVKAANVKLPEKTDHEKVKVYLFWASWCPHCHDFIKYFSDKYDQYSDYFEIVTYQVNVGSEQKQNVVNSTLMGAVGERIGKTTGGIPLIVVGENFSVAGFGDDGTEIIQAALDAYQDENYKDVVQEEIKANNLESEPADFTTACKAAGIECNAAPANQNEQKEQKGLSDTAILGIVFGVIVLGFGGLVIYSRKQ